MTDPLGRRVLILLALGTLACGQRVDRDPFLVLAGPQAVERIDVIDAEGMELWVIEAQTPREVDFILYRVVPEGFIQLEPTANRRPRPLEPGELLRTQTRTRRRLFTHFGVASSASTMEIYNFSMALRQLPGGE